MTNSIVNKILHCNKILDCNKICEPFPFGQHENKQLKQRRLSVLIIRDSRPVERADKGQSDSRGRTRDERRPEAIRGVITLGVMERLFRKSIGVGTNEFFAAFFLASGWTVEVVDAGFDVRMVESPRSNCLNSNNAKPYS